MQSVSDMWSVEAYDTYRNIAHSVQLAWKKNYLINYRPFTIGVSTIGGNDPIASSGAIVSDWNKYVFQDESDYAKSISYERSLQQPIGGISKALADVDLINSSNRFLPDYMGGNSELFTAILPRRPIIINAGFDFSGVYYTLPQFVGLLSKTPQINTKQSSVRLSAFDFIDYLYKQDVSDASMFTGQRSDVVIENILTQLGFSTAQYQLDYGINVINFGEFQPGDKFGDVINKIVQAENGFFYQDEIGKLHFDNRQHWDNNNTIQRVIPTSMVIDSESQSDSQILNVIEINGKYMQKQPLQLIWKQGGTIIIDPSSNKEVFVNFSDAVLAADSPINYEATDQEDGGSDMSASISISQFSLFARAAKIVITNSSTKTVYLKNMEIYGRPVKETQKIFHREQDDSSVTAYEERLYKIDNPYIQDPSTAKSLARMILNDYSEPSNLQKITIRAIPELQLGDLISWQGRYWRIITIKAKINPSDGFVQELDLLQRQLTSYFRIGISTIGSTDKIAP